jgi:hypothetical protein
VKYPSHFDTEWEQMMNWDAIGAIGEILGGLAVIAGIGFGFTEYRRHKVKESREALDSLVRSFQTQELAAALRVVLELPGPIDIEQYRVLPERDRDLLWILFTSMESIGYLVHRGDLTLSLVDEFFSIPAVHGWKHLRPYVEEFRQEYDAPQAWEWFQWLSEHIAESHRQSPRIPAHIAHPT